MAEAGFDITNARIITPEDGFEEPDQDDVTQRGLTDGWTKWAPLVRGGPVTIPYFVHDTASSFHSIIQVIFSITKLEYKPFLRPHLYLWKTISAVFLFRKFPTPISTQQRSSTESCLSATTPAATLLSASLLVLISQLLASLQSHNLEFQPAGK